MPIKLDRPQTLALLEVATLLETKVGNYSSIEMHDAKICPGPRGAVYAFEVDVLLGGGRMCRISGSLIQDRNIGPLILNEEFRITGS